MRGAIADHSQALEPFHHPPHPNLHTASTFCSFGSSWGMGSLVPVLSEKVIFCVRAPPVPHLCRIALGMMGVRPAQPSWIEVSAVIAPGNSVGARQAPSPSRLPPLLFWERKGVWEADPGHLSLTGACARGHFVLRMLSTPFPAGCFACTLPDPGRSSSGVEAAVCWVLYPVLSQG